MNSEILAAWVGAGAAAVQAVGAILAIIYSVKLARAADRRATESEKTSVAREEAARLASSEREKAIQKAADYRIRREHMDRHNGFLFLVSGPIKDAREELAAEIENLQNDPIRMKQNHRYKFDSGHLRRLKESIPGLQQRAQEPALLASLSRVARGLDELAKKSTYRDLSGPNTITFLGDIDNTLKILLDDLAAAREGEDPEDGETS